MAIEIVSFPIKTVIFHSYVSLPEGITTVSSYQESEGRSAVVLASTVLEQCSMKAKWMAGWWFGT